METLKNIQKTINQEFGEGTAFVFGENEKLPSVDTISTGSFGLDRKSGGGIPRGRITEIFGNPQSGKTTIALHCVAEAQKQGLRTAFIDIEQALDVLYAKNLGIDLSSMLIAQPECGEDALRIVENLVKDENFQLIVIDSVAAMVTRSEIEGDFGDANMGSQARLMSQAMRKLVSIVKKHNVALVFINQTRMKIGVLFGNPETTTGGNALKFYASLRIHTKTGKKVTKDEVAVGTDVEAYIVKNKMVAPFQKANFQIIFGKGIDRTGEIIDIGIKMGVVSKSGSWLSYGKDRIGHGKEKTTHFLNNHPDVLEKIKNEIETKTEILIEGEQQISERDEEEKEQNLQ